MPRSNSWNTDLNTSYAGVTSPAPVPSSAPASSRLSNTMSIRPNALASSLSKNLSQSIALSVSASGWPVYFGTELVEALAHAEDLAGLDLTR